MDTLPLETLEPLNQATLEQLRAENQFLRAQHTAMMARAEVTALIAEFDTYGQPIWFDAVSDAIFVTDFNLQIQHWNRAAEQIYGWPRTEVIGRPVMELIPALHHVDGQSNTSLLHTVMTTGAWRGEIVQHTRAGHEVVIESSMRALIDDQSLVVGYIAINRDITARKQAEAALRESETRLHLLAEHAHDMIFRYRLAPTLTLEYISPVVEQLTGYSREVFYADPELSLRLVFPEDVSSTSYVFTPNAVPEQPIVLRWYHKDGTPRWAELYSWMVSDENGQPLTVDGIVRDITERKQAEAELRASAEQLQSLSRRLVEAHERERRHIARELHDEVGQVLTGLKLTLAVAATGAPAALAMTLESAQMTMNELLGRVRSLSLDLRPALLDDLGLLPALVWYLERYTSRTGVQVDLRHEGVSRRFPAEVETVAYRIVQEALTNVARHAGVPNATVRLLADVTRLMLRVDDGGRGFDPAVALAAQKTGGLSGMHERVQLIGGVLTMESTPGNGTQIIAELPLPNTEPNQ